MAGDKIRIRPEWMQANPCKSCSMSGRAECQECNRDKEPVKELLKYLNIDMVWLPPQSVKMRKYKDSPVTAHIRVGTDMRMMAQSSIESMLTQLEEIK
jgi:hypothetical protein